MENKDQLEKKSNHGQGTHREARIEAHVQALQRDTVSKVFKHFTMDIGPRGSSLSGEQQLTDGQMLMMTLYLPPASRRKELKSHEIFPTNECTPVSILCRVTWCTQGSPTEFKYGVSFLDLERNQRVQLKKFLIDMGLDDMSSSLYL